MRAPESEPAATLHALEVLAEIDALDDPMVAGRRRLGRDDRRSGRRRALRPADRRGPSARAVDGRRSDGGSFLTFALAAVLCQADARTPWLERAAEWCWAQLARPDELGAYGVKFALDFLDGVPDAPRAAAVIETLRPRVGADGSIAVTGGTENERLTPLALSVGRVRAAAPSSPTTRSRSTSIRSSADSRTTAAGRSTGSAWSPGQSVEWRGIVTLRALATLRAHGRIGLPHARS